VLTSTTRTKRHILFTDVSVSKCGSVKVKYSESVTSTPTLALLPKAMIAAVTVEIVATAVDAVAVADATTIAVAAVVVVVVADVVDVANTSLQAAG
jgi:hypothetical protein